MHIYNWYHSNVIGIHYIHEHRLQYTWRIPLAFYLPLSIPFAPLSDPSVLTCNPPSCDRIRPPRSQAACKLTSPFSTLSPIPPPSEFPEPRLPSASLWRPQESSISCPEQVYLALRHLFRFSFSRFRAKLTTDFVLLFALFCIQFSVSNAKIFIQHGMQHNHDMQHLHETFTQAFSKDTWHGRATRTCSMYMPYVNPARTCYTDMQHGNAARTCSTDN